MTTMLVIYANALCRIARRLQADKWELRSPEKLRQRQRNLKIRNAILRRLGA